MRSVGDAPSNGRTLEDASAAILEADVAKVSEQVERGVRAFAAKTRTGSEHSATLLLPN
jgi:hypothetical protein